MFKIESIRRHVLLAVSAMGLGTTLTRTASAQWVTDLSGNPVPISQMNPAQLQEQLQNYRYAAQNYKERANPALTWQLPQSQAAQLQQEHDQLLQQRAQLLARLGTFPSNTANQIRAGAAGPGPYTGPLNGGWPSGSSAGGTQRWQLPNGGTRNPFRNVRGSGVTPPKLPPVNIGKGTSTVPPTIRRVTRPQPMTVRTPVPTRSNSGGQGLANNIFSQSVDSRASSTVTNVGGTPNPTPSNNSGSGVHASGAIIDQ